MTLSPGLRSLIGVFQVECGDDGLGELAGGVGADALPFLVEFAVEDGLGDVVAEVVSHGCVPRSRRRPP